MQYLSDEWIQAAADALAAAAPIEVPEGEPVTSIQYEVSAAPGGKARYGVVLDGGALRLVPGKVEDPSVKFELDYPTAAAIARNELSAQAAFMQGKIKLGGNVTVLIEQAGLLGGIHDALGELRSTTEY